MGVITEAIEKAKVEKETAISLTTRFEPFEQQANEWKEKAFSLVVTDVNQSDLMATARESRLAIRQVRLSVDKLHKELKEDSLKKGQVLDLIKRTLLGMIEPIETHLEKQENFKEIKEAEEITARYNERHALLKPYEFVVGQFKDLPIGTMNQDAFDTFLMGLKVQKEQREAEQAELERQRKENEDNARKEAEIKDRQLTRSRELSALKFTWENNQYVHHGIQYALSFEKLGTMKDDDFNPLIADLRRMVFKYNEDQQREKTRIENIERENQDRIKKEELELKEKKLAERRAKRAPDKVKLLEFANRIKALEAITMKDDDAQEIYNNALGLLAKVVTYIEKNANNL